MSEFPDHEVMPSADVPTPPSEPPPSEVEPPVVDEPVVDEPVADEPVAVPVVSASGPGHRRQQPGPLPPPPGSKSGTEESPVANAEAGRIVGGLATVITPDEVEIVLEDGRLAVVHRRNFAPTATEDLTKVVTLGDRIEGAILARHDPRERVVLSRAWALEKRTWERLVESAAQHTALTCRVTGSSKNGLVVDVEGVRGFVPLSHTSLEPGADLGSMVGQSIEFKIIEIDPDPRKRRLVLSRRSILLREQRREAHEVLATIRPGEVRRGSVSSLSDYGAFVDLGGINGLIHVSELAWHKVGHPRDIVSPGDEVEVKVLEVKVKKRRVRLSLREVTPDPIASVVVGAVLTGRITHLVDFGAFVDVGGIEGLVHLSEMAEYRVYAPEELVTPGEEVMVKVLSVDPKRRRIELSIRQAVSDQFG